MLTSEQIDRLIAEWKLFPVTEKSVVLAEFLKEYGENAVWEEWVTFLQERPELEGFQWARSLAGLPPC
jgi:hypothetical protein